MLKKTLLAIAIASITSTVSAASLNSGVTFDDVSGVTAASINGSTGDCQDVADDLGVTLTLATFTATPGSDNATKAAGSTDVFSSVSSVTLTANDECTIVAADTASTAATSASIEFANKTGNSITFTPSLITGSGGYAVGDILAFNITGGSFDLTKAAPTVITSDSGAAAFFDITANQVRFDVSTVVVGSEVITLTGAFLSATGLTDSTEVSVSSIATRSGTTFDAAAGFKAATLAPQYSAKVSKKLNGVIDVSEERQALTAGNDSANIDKLSVKVKLDVTGNKLDPAITSYVIGGDFAWLSASAQVTVDAVAVTPAELETYLTGLYVGTGDDTLKSVSLNTDMDKLTVITNAVGNDIDTESTFSLTTEGKAAGSPVLSASAYDVTVTVDDGTSATATTLTAGTTMDAGEWTLNGSTIEIPYMPYGDNTQVILRQTVTGTQSGDISVRYMLEGVDSTWNTVGVVGTSAPGVQDISNIVMDAIKSDSGESKGKVAIEITSNVPSDSATTYAAYKVISESDRGFVGIFTKAGE